MQSIITECDLAVSLGSLGIGIVGPGRLSTQVDNNPPSQIQPLHVETPLNSFSSTVWSSSEVFLVDGVVVKFAGLSTGEVRKVRMYSILYVLWFVPLFSTSSMLYSCTVHSC